MSLHGQLKMYWHFAWGLRKFLRETVTLEQSRQIIRERLNNRENNLLTMVKRSIYENPSSPYLKLLRLAGCEYADFKQLIDKNGIEPALQKIGREGVYISVEEFKGKKELTRGGRSFKFKEADFDNPFRYGHLAVTSGTSRSAGTRTIYDFDFLADETLYRSIRVDAYDLANIPYAVWYPIMPGAGPKLMVTSARAGETPLRWFSPVERRDFRPSLKNRMGTNYIVFAGRLFGAKWPAPEYVALDEAWKVAEWIAGAIKKEGGCYFSTYASAAVRICQAATERGLNIAGTKFIASGEPTTEAKRKEIESSGACVYPSYVVTEAGTIGYGCGNPVADDEVHFFKDKLALIQQSREVPHADLSVDAFLFTTLLPSAPKILLNVESGDYGIVGTRSCGCKFEELGFTDHIHNIRGFDKLTGEGMTFIGTDLVRIIEEVLPARFGGTSINYQMVEEEDEQEHTRMSIIVSPEVGEINENELIQVILAELSKGKDTQRMMAQVWSKAKTLRVKRISPFISSRGKLLPLHIQKKR